MLTKLKTLYSIVEGYKDLEMKMGEDTIFQMNEKEEEIIRTEILPIIGKDIEPTLHEFSDNLYK